MSTATANRIETLIKWSLVALIIGVTIYAGITQPERLFS